MFDAYLIQAGLIVAVCSGLPVLAGSICGLIAAVVQTATQIQEQSISYLSKLCAVIVVLVLCWNWFAAQLVQFTTEILGSLAMIGRMR